MGNNKKQKEAPKVQEIKKETITETNTEIKPEIKPEINLYMDRINHEQALIDKAILDANDSDKLKKDVLLKNADELQKHVVYLQNRIQELSGDFETKKRLVDSVNGSIAGAQTELSNLKMSFEKNNSRLLEEFKKKQAEVEAADKTLRALIKENEELHTHNKVEFNNLAEHRQLCDAQVYEMKKALAQNQSEWNKREADILKREEILKDEKLAFEKEKEELLPEAARVSAIKNENLLLLQKIEMDRIDIANLRLSIVSEKERLNEEKASHLQGIKNRETAIANEEARLRQWEENIKFFDLQVRAKSAEAEKVLRRAQLEKEVNSVK